VTQPSSYGENIRLVSQWTFSGIGLTFSFPPGITFGTNSYTLLFDSLNQGSGWYLSFPYNTDNTAIVVNSLSIPAYVTQQVTFYASFPSYGGFDIQHGVATGSTFF